MRAFFKLECRVALRRYRWLLLGLVFLLFGIEAPLVAKLTPVLVQSLGTDLRITMPAPTSVTAWQQYYKTATQIGALLLALASSGTVSRELAGGTLVNLVTKDLTRPTVIAVKYLIAVGEWLACMGLAALTSWGYTAYYFKDDQSAHPLAALMPLLLFGLLFMALTVFGSTLSKSGVVGFAVAAGTQLALTLVNLWAPAQRFNPVSLVSDNLAILQGQERLAHLVPAMVITVLAAGALVGAGIEVLKRKRL